MRVRRRTIRAGVPALALLLGLLAGDAMAEEPATGPPKVRTTAEVLAAAGPADWRPLDPENTLVMTLPSGRVVLELAPWMAPRHVANIRALVDAGYFDGSAILRSQDDYVVQWGDPAGEGEPRRSLGEAAASLPPEWERPIDPKVPFTPLGDPDTYAPLVGFSRELPAGRDAEAGLAWLAHCYGMVGVGRDVAPDSGNGAELYVVIGHAPRHLDRNVTLVGRVVQGMEHLSTLPRGTGPLGFYETAEERVPIRSIRRAASLPEGERPSLEVLRTDTATFEDLIRSRRYRTEDWFVNPVGAVELCNVPLPVREIEEPPTDDSADRCPELADRLDAIEALLERRPEDATVHYYHALTLAACGDPVGTVAALERVLENGDGFLPAPGIGFEKVSEDPAYAAMVETMEAALPRVDAAEVAFRIDGAGWIPEGIAWDDASRRLFVGSMARGAILAVAGDGGQSVFANGADGLRSVLGLAIDRERGRLLAVDSGQILPPTVGDAARPDRVVILDLASGAVVRSLEAPEGFQLNDVTVGLSGTVWASATALGAVLRAGPGDETLTPWEEAPVLPGANGLALDPAESALYVAHNTGVARLDLAGGDAVARLPVAGREALGAIDGLYWRDGSLIGIQNVTNPGRVIEARLAEDGRSVTAVRTLLSHHHPALDEPTTGAVAEDRFFVLANSFVARLQPDGTLEDEATIAAPVILAVELEGTP